MSGELRDRISSASACQSSASTKTGTMSEFPSPNKRRVWQRKQNKIKQNVDVFWTWHFIVYIVDSCYSQQLYEVTKNTELADTKELHLGQIHGYVSVSIS
jgi:hypothetical protein